VCCLFHRLHKGLCRDGNIGLLILRDGAVRTPEVNSDNLPASHMDLACPLALQQPDWTAESNVSIPLQFHCISLTRLSVSFRGVAPPDCIFVRRTCSPKAGWEERSVVNSAELYYERI
jgi:hypothetical protein